MNISKSKGGLLRLVQEQAVPYFRDLNDGEIHSFPARTREAGRGELVFEKLGDKTILSRVYAQSPLKWIRTSPKSSAVWIYSSNYGGGLLGGDHLRLNITVGQDATAFLTTQASTKIYRSDSSAQQSMEARLERGAKLVWLPDPVVCFEGSQYGQMQDFHLKKGSGLVLQDCFSSGRRTRKERWKFRGYSSRTRVLEGERLVFYDALRLDTQAGPLEERLGRFNLMAYVLIYGEPFRLHKEQLLRSWTPPPGKRKPSLLQYMSPVGKEGLVWRLAGEEPQEVEGLIRQRLSFLSELLGDDPWARKQGQ